MEMRAAIYARVSSDIQKDADTIASQLTQLPKFVAARGWKLVGEPYIDDGFSAKSGKLHKRLGFQRLAKDMEAGKIDVVAVVDMDRLTRSEDLEERGKILGLFQRHKVQIAELNGAVHNLGEFSGDFMVTIKAIMAADENRKRSERTVRGKIEAIGQGRKPSGPTPFGYLYDRDTRTWSIDPILGPIVKEIYTKIVKGQSCEQIAIDLEKRGVMRARPSKSGKRKPGVWCRERCWQIAVAPTYRGEYTADKKRRLKIPVPPIVTDELWERCQEVLSVHKKRGLRKVKHVYLIGGIAKCALCESPIGCMAVKNNRGELVRYYICTRRRRAKYGETRCLLPYFQAAPVDERLWQRLYEYFSQPHNISGLLKNRADAAKKAKRDWPTIIAEHKKRLERLQEKESALLKRFTADAISESVMDAQLKVLSQERRDVKRQIEEAEAAAKDVGHEQAKFDDALAMAAELRAKFAKFKGADREMIVKGLISSGEITLHKDGKLTGSMFLPTKGLDTVRGDGYNYVSRNNRDLSLEIAFVA